MGTEFKEETSGILAERVETGHWQTLSATGGEVTEKWIPATPATDMVVTEDSDDEDATEESFFESMSKDVKAVQLASAPSLLVQAPSMLLQAPAPAPVASAEDSVQLVQVGYGSGSGSGYARDSEQAEADIVDAAEADAAAAAAAAVEDAAAAALAHAQHIIAEAM